ncbi:MAG: hypothetical protein RXQ00_00855 [Caldivirga sp.]
MARLVKNAITVLLVILILILRRGSGDLLKIYINNVKALRRRDPGTAP